MPGTGVVAFAGDVEPSEAWRHIKEKSSAHLVDVRTSAEWAFVGLADLSAASKAGWTIEWKRFPDMGLNPDFFARLAAEIAANDASDVFFICRSGQRSRDAAIAGTTASEIAGLERPLTFYNVATGFEGDLNPSTGRRAELNGWKRDGLPWRQS